jgi:hypothetical protein
LFVETGPREDIESFDKEVFFVAQKTQRSFYWSVQRLAVLVPLYGRRVLNSEKHFRGLTRQTVERWRSLEELAGERLSQAPGRSLKRRNCRPGFAEFRPRTNFCNENTLCPFCWARTASTVWSAIDRSMFNADHPGGSVGAPYDVYFVNRSVVVANNLRELIAGRTAERRRERSYLRCLAGYEVSSAEPHEIRTPELPTRTMRFHTRQLFIVRPDDALGSFPLSTSVRVTRFARPTRSQIALLVARMCRYPVGFLKPPSPEYPLARAVVAYLDARHRCKLWTPFGQLRMGEAAAGSLETPRDFYSQFNVPAARAMAPDAF